MTIKNINELGAAFSSVENHLKELIKARDEVYSEIQRIYNNGDLSNEGKTKQETQIRKVWAEQKKQSIYYLQSVLDAILEWDEGNNTIDLNEKDFERFKGALMIAVNVGSAATPELLNGIVKMCSNRIQLEAIYSVLKQKGANTSVFEDRIYNPSQLIDSTKRTVRECLQSDDFMLDRLVSAFENVSRKLRNYTGSDSYKLVLNVNATIDTDVKINKGMGTLNYPYATATPIGTEILVNGELSNISL